MPVTTPAPITLSDIQTKNQQLLKKQQIQKEQLLEIQEKEKLLLTRSRMLQIVQDKNSFKKNHKTLEIQHYNK